MERMKQSLIGIRALHAKRDLRESELDLNSVRPYGRHGVGTLTAHPVGLVVVLGVIIMAMMKLPPRAPSLRVQFLSAGYSDFSFGSVTAIAVSSSLTHMRPPTFLRASCFTCR
jgi:hypothetical protein